MLKIISVNKKEKINSRLQSALAIFTANHITQPIQNLLESDESAKKVCANIVKGIQQNPDQMRDLLKEPAENFIFGFVEQFIKHLTLDLTSSLTKELSTTTLSNSDLEFIQTMVEEFRTVQTALMVSQLKTRFQKFLDPELDQLKNLSAIH